MKYCSDCGHTIEYRVPGGDQRERATCQQCGAIHYQNPRIVAGCVVEHQGRILLCRRAIEPRRGYWTVPAGFMEMGEGLQQAALRETFEEALAEARLGSMLAVVNVLHTGQVHIFFRAVLPEPQFASGTESLEVRLFDEAEIPWQEMAFSSGVFSLQHYFADRRAGVEQLHFLDLP